MSVLHARGDYAHVLRDQRYVVDGGGGSGLHVYATGRASRHVEGVFLVDSSEYGAHPSTLGVAGHASRSHKPRARVSELHRPGDGGGPLRVHGCQL